MEERSILIADGHHRYEVGLAYQERLRQRDPSLDPRATPNYILMYLARAEDPGLVILPTHRVIGKGAVSESSLLASLRDRFSVESFPLSRREEFLLALKSLQSSKRGFGLYFGRSQKYHLACWTRVEPRLDVSVLHEDFLDKLGPEKIAYFKDTEEVFRAVSDSPDSLAIFLNPPAIVELFGAVESGVVLPPKTTYFYPKLLTGLLFYRLDPRVRVEV
jgi:uncharacterized protein (DUF1015 family)